MNTDGASSELRLESQIQFLMELDKLKSVLRRSILSHENRRENSGEHSWHVSMVALTLLEHADEQLDTLKVLKMLMIHDIVEIDAGDVYIYDKHSNEGKVDREREAARRIFGLLPDDQELQFRELWEEFEAKETAEAKFAGACDRLIPLLHNFYAKGHSWKENGIELDSVWEINSVIEEGSKSLWNAAKKIIHESVSLGYLKDT
jgi:putative hydrolase of HD superfamily